MAISSTKSKFILGALLLLLAAGALYIRYSPPATAVPEAFSLPVPFTTQAPTGNWTGNENCEEASAIMANAFLNGDGMDSLSQGRVTAEIAALVRWEEDNLGHNANTGADDVAKMISDVYGLKTEKIADYSESQLRSQLSEGRPVLLMIDASKLGNPTYKNNGRLYHVIVVRGFDNQGFRINDPGTEKGENTPYSFETLKNAAADWSQGEKTLKPDEKIAIAVYK